MMSSCKWPIKVNPVAKIMQSAYLCVIIHLERKKLPFLAVLTWFLIHGNSKMAAKMATIFGDVTGLQQRHHPWNIPHLVKKIKGFPLKVKLFQNTATRIKNSGEGFHPPYPPPPPCTTVGVRICVYVRGLKRENSYLAILLKWNSK